MANKRTYQPQSPQSLKKKPRAFQRGNSETQFPGKLHDMMDYVERHGLESTTISWIQNGTGIIIHDPKQLMHILPYFFGQTQYRSFRRQLNMWHFQRINTGPNKGGLMHPFFIKGRKSLCSYMSRYIDPDEFKPSPLSLEAQVQTSSMRIDSSLKKEPPIPSTKSSSFADCGSDDDDIQMHSDDEMWQTANLQVMTLDKDSHFVEREIKPTNFDGFLVANDERKQDLVVNLPSKMPDIELEGEKTRSIDDDDELNFLFKTRSSSIDFIDNFLLGETLEEIPLGGGLLPGMSNPASPEAVKSIFEELSELEIL